MITSRLPGMAWCAAYAWLTGMMSSRSPQMIKVGIWRGQVEPIHRTHCLTAGVDDGPDSAGERPAVLRLGERSVGAPHLSDPTQADTAVIDKAEQAVSPIVYEPRENHGHQVFAPR